MAPTRSTTTTPFAANWERHSEVLSEKPEVIVANKSDLDPEGEQLAHVRDQLGPDIPAISAATGQGIKELKEVLWQKVKERKSPS